MNSPLPFSIASPPFLRRYAEPSFPSHSSLHSLFPYNYFFLFFFYFFFSSPSPLYTIHRFSRFSVSVSPAQSSINSASLSSAHFSLPFPLSHFSLFFSLLLLFFPFFFLFLFFSFFLLQLLPTVFFLLLVSELPSRSHSSFLCTALLLRRVVYFPPFFFYNSPLPSSLPFPSLWPLLCRWFPSLSLSLPAQLHTVSPYRSIYIYVCTCVCVCGRKRERGRAPCRQ